MQYNVIVHQVGHLPRAVYRVTSMMDALNSHGPVLKLKVPMKAPIMYLLLRCLKKCSLFMHEPAHSKKCQ